MFKHVCIKVCRLYTHTKSQVHVIYQRLYAMWRYVLMSPDALSIWRMQMTSAHIAFPTLQAHLPRTWASASGIPKPMWWSLTACQILLRCKLVGHTCACMLLWNFAEQYLVTHIMYKVCTHTTCILCRKFGYTHHAFYVYAHQLYVPYLKARPHRK